MNILLCEGISKTNQYIKQLATAYQDKGHCVIFDVHNFLFSDFLPDFVHLQWPEAIYRWRYQLRENKSTLKLLNERLSYYSSAKIPIVYTVHNMLPHENVTDFDKAAYSIFLSFSDIIVHHGKASISMLNNAFPECSNAHHVVCPHGHYPCIATDGKLARSMYKLPYYKYIFLNFGRQRLNKGLNFIKIVFKNWSNHNACLFTIGPEGIGKKEKNILFKLVNRLRQEIGLNFFNDNSILSKNMKNILRPVTNEEIPQILAAVDVFFLGHQEGLNSGLLALAASYGKPVVFPDIGNFKEQLINWHWKESYEVGNVNSAIEALKRICKRIDQYPPGNVIFDNKDWLNSNSWNKHVQIIINEVRKLKLI